MSKFQVLMYYSNGETELDEEEFDDEETATEYGDYLVSCGRAGAEILEMSNPGDYPMDDYEDADFDVIKIE